MLFRMFCFILILLVPEKAAQDSLFAKFKQSDYNVDFEWGETVRYDKTRLKKFDFRVFKYNRTTTAANITFESFIDVKHDLEYVIQVYKFGSNEYRLFPVRFQFNYCAGLVENIAGALRTFNCGNFTGCPIKKGKVFHVCNFAPDQSQLPPYVPSGRFKIEIQALFRQEETFVVNVYVKVYRPIAYE